MRSDTESIEPVLPPAFACENTSIGALLTHIEESVEDWAEFRYMSIVPEGKKNINVVISHL